MLLHLPANSSILNMTLCAMQLHAHTPIRTGRRICIKLWLSPSSWLFASCLRSTGTALARTKDMAIPSKQHNRVSRLFRAQAIHGSQSKPEGEEASGLAVEACVRAFYSGVGNEPANHETGICSARDAACTRDILFPAAARESTRNLQLQRTSRS